MRKLLIIALFLCFYNFSYSRNIQSNGNGNWLVNSTWLNNLSPQNGDTITILKDDTVTINSNINTGSWYIYVKIYGVLRFTDGSHKISVNENSIFNIFTGGLIQSTDLCNCNHIKIGNNIEWKGNDGNIIGPDCLPQGACDNTHLSIKDNPIIKRKDEDIFEKIEIYNSNRVLNIEVISKEDDEIYLEVHTMDGKKLFYDLIIIHKGENHIEYEFYNYRKDVYIITFGDVKKKLMI